MRTLLITRVLKELFMTKDFNGITLLTLITFDLQFTFDLHLSVTRPTTEPIEKSTITETPIGIRAPIGIPMLRDTAT